MCLKSTANYFLPKKGFSSIAFQFYLIRRDWLDDYISTSKLILLRVTLLQMFGSNVLVSVGLVTDENKQPGVNLIYSVNFNSTTEILLEDQ